MNLTNLSLRRPVTTVMAFVAMLLFGLAAARLLPLELFPGIDVPQVVVQVPYKGSSPAEVERDITRVLEESLATMSGIEEMTSESSQDGATIELQMKWGEDSATKALEAREKVDAVRHLLPKDVERVLILQFSTSDMPIFTIRIASERELSGAYDLLEKQLRQPVERVAGVSRVTLYGVEQKQISIRVDADRLSASGLSPAALDKRLQAENFILSGGSLRENGTLYQLTPKGEFRSLADIEALILAPGIHLGDIATVQFELPERVEGRHLDRRYAVGLDVFKESGANLVDVASRVMEVIDTVKTDKQFSGIKIFIMEDQAYGVKSSLWDLLMSGVVGALLSFAVLYLFLRNIAMTLIVVTSVPISVGITLAAMYVLGYSLNVLSMMGLLLAVGMLIDNAVVVTESVMQEQAKHQLAEQHSASQGTASQQTASAQREASTQPAAKQQQAILTGVNKVSLAVLAGTLTTAIVFLPNIFGAKVQLTIFLEHVAIAICISLATSLLVAKTLIPLMLSRISIQQQNTLDKSRLQHFYEQSLHWVLHHPKISAAVAFALLASTALPLMNVKQDAEDGSSNQRLFINYQIEGRHALGVTEATVAKMEEYLYANQEAFFIDSVYSYYSPERASSTILFKKEAEFDLEVLKKQIRDGFPKLAIAKPQLGWSNDQQGLRVTLTGSSTSELIRISEAVIPLLASIDGLEDVNSEVSGAQQEVLVRVNRDMAARLDTQASDIARAIATALRGQMLRSFRHDPSGEIRIELGYDKSWRQSLEQLKSLPVIRINEQVYSLASLAEIEIVPRFDIINHLNRKTALSIGANTEGITTEEAQDKINAVMQQINLPAGYSYSLRGGFERQDEDQQIMVVNMLLAVAMIYIVMAALFESLLLPAAIITSILFSITGVFWALWLTGTPNGIMAMIGVLILMGVVVNNGIVLVDQINQMTPKLEELSATIHAVCITRLRPVLMTVGTTVLGLVPLALDDTQIGGGGPPYYPMAIAIIGGLTFSTVTSLYLVPLCYQALYIMRHRAAQGLWMADKRANKWLPWIKVKSS